MIQWIEMEALFKQTLKKKIPVGFKIKKKNEIFLYNIWLIPSDFYLLTGGVDEPQENTDR